MSAQVAVVGGGLSGLLIATALRRSGVDDVVVLEASPRPGGVSGTVRRDGYLVERAASTLRLPHPHLSPLLATLGLTPVPVDPAASGRFVHSDGRLHEIPLSPRILASPIVGPGAKLRILGEPLVRRRGDGDESLADFLSRRFGAGAGDMIGWLMAGGVFAGDPARLSVKAAFPMLAALEAEAGSVIRGGLRRRRAARGATPPSAHVLPGGMQDVVDSAHRLLGDGLWLGAAVESVAPTGGGWRLTGEFETLSARHVVLAVDPDHAAPLVDAELTEALRGSVAAPVVVAGLGGPDAAMAPRRGFGVLTGPDTGFVVRGILFESAQAAGRAPAGHTLLRVIAGGAGRPDVAGRDDATLRASLVSESSAILGSDLSPDFVEIVRHPRGIPQYAPGHPAWLANLEALLAHRPGLHVAGWSYRGVGVTALATEAHRLAATLAGGPGHAGGAAGVQGQDARREES